MTDYALLSHRVTNHDHDIKELRDSVRAIHKRIDSVLLLVLGSLITGTVTLIAVLAGAST